MNFKSVIVCQISAVVLLFSSSHISAQSTNTATYEVTFTNLWNAEDHVRFPGNAHFSPIIAVNHNDDFELFAVGERVSDGFEQLAELGNNSLLKDELKLAEEQEKSIGKVTESNSFFPNTKGEEIIFETSVTREKPYLSLATMIAPSPDWIVGFSSLPLYTDGAFVKTIQLDLYALNAGTEEGDIAGNFSIRNEATVPQNKVSPLWRTRGLNRPFATVTLKLKK